MRSSLEGERKHVTVLFADLVGSTALHDAAVNAVEAITAYGGKLTLLDEAAQAMARAVR